MRKCVECKAAVTGHNKAVRCRACAARKRYIDKHGKPPTRVIAKCEVCRKEFSDYATNRKKQKHGVLFCSPTCRVAWVGVRNSIARGGDGIKRSKAEKDAYDYRRNADARRAGATSYYQANRARILEQKRTQDRALKREVIDAYGGKCECCGETHIEFLTIDHTNGDGAAHRKRCGKGRKVYADIKARGFPKGCYRCLCLNCNIALGFYGYCPHRPNERRKVSKVPHNPGRKRIVV